MQIRRLSPEGEREQMFVRWVMGKKFKRLF